MIDVAEAMEIVLAQKMDYGTEKVPVVESIGRILAEEINADRDFPPFDRVCMDGIAIKYSSFKQGQRLFEVEKVGPAGKVQQVLEDPKKCIEIMTGAPLPKGTDTIIRYEDLKEIDNSFKVLIEVKPDANIHNRGSDHSSQSLLLHKNSKIKSIDINVLATVGKSSVRVYKNPRVAVISSGEELVDVHEKPLAHQIRKSNVYMIMARLRELGIQADSFHFRDDSMDIVNQIKNIINSFDVLLMSGGVSAGKFDFIPSVLEAMKFEKLFHKVLQRPGKPFWFGRKNKKLVFAFPGNPVSTLACFHKYFIPWFYKAINAEIKHTIPVVLKSDVSFKPDLTYFAQSKLELDSGGVNWAIVDHGNGSGDMVNPTQMDGFLELPRGKQTFTAGEVYNFIPFSTIYR